MLELVLISPLPSRSVRAGPGHMPGFLRTLLLLLGWNLALIRAGVRLSSRSNMFDDEFHGGILYLHLGALLLIPLEPFAIRAVGLWWSWRSGKPDRAAIVLFFVHVVLPAPLFVATVPILDTISGSIGRWLMRTSIPCIIIRTLIRGILALSLLLWSRPDNRDNMVRSRAGSMPERVPARDAKNPWNGPGSPRRRRKGLPPSTSLPIEHDPGSLPLAGTPRDQPWARYRGPQAGRVNRTGRIGTSGRCDPPRNTGRDSLSIPILRQVNRSWSGGPRRTMNLWPIPAREFRVLCHRGSIHAAWIVLAGMVTVTRKPRPPSRPPSYPAVRRRPPPRTP